MRWILFEDFLKCLNETPSNFRMFTAYVWAMSEISMNRYYICEFHLQYIFISYANSVKHMYLSLQERIRTWSDRKCGKIAPETVGRWHGPSPADLRAKSIGWMCVCYRNITALIAFRTHFYVSNVLWKTNS
jgi:hypothetical protein